MRRRLPVFLMVVLLAGPALAAEPEGRYSLAAGAGVALPLHGDFDFTAASWQADARIDVGKYFATGVFFERWRHSDKRVLTNQVLYGPNARIGQVDRIEIATTHVTRTVGWSALGRAPMGRLTLTGGAGIGTILYTRDVEQTLTGCVATQADACRNPHTENRFTNLDLSLHLQGGADVAVTSHVGVTAQFRAIAPVQDPSAGHASLTAGLRARF